MLGGFVFSLNKGMVANKTVDEIEFYIREGDIVTRP
jgi:hypothetical protein